MTNLILVWVVCSTVITSLINTMKPAYKQFSGKRCVTISTILAFGLGILCAFSVIPLLGLEVNTGLTILIWLALGTGSNIFYDVLNLINSRSDKLKK